ncbi:MAG: ROK family protein [Candidatus Krumholzibacteriia bacterium]
MGDLVIGADVGGTRVKYVLADASGSVIARGDIGTDPGDPGDTLERLVRAAREAASGHGGLVTAAGLACAGIVSPEDGWLGRSPNLPGWEKRALGDLAAGVIGAPVALANDVNAALYGEARFGAGVGCRDLVMVALGTGVGGGLLLDGKLRIGANNGAGEIGHVVLDPEGPRCSCGNEGCLEAYAGSVGMLRRATELAAGTDATPAFQRLMTGSGTQPTTAALHVLAEEGDPCARKLFREVGLRLGQAVANVANLLDPERVIIGGGVAQAGELILGPCREQVRRLVLSEQAKQLPVVPAQLGPHAAARGAAALAAERVI